MPHAPPQIARAILVCRSLAAALEAAALAYCLNAADLSFSSIIFLKLVLAVHLPLTVIHLFYDAGQVFMHEPLPEEGRLMAGLLVAEWIGLVMLFAAGVSSAAVVEYLYRGLRKCPALPPYFCARYAAAVFLTLGACAVNAAIAFMMFWLGVFWDLAAQNAAAAEAAAAAAAAAAAEAAADQA